MTTLSLTDVSTGAPILAANVNNGWSSLRSVINGNLDETNFASGQLYSLSKIKQDGASANDVMYWTGSTWDNTPLTTVGRGLVAVVYARDATTTTLTNSTTETAMLSQTITGGHMSTNRMLRFTVLGDIAATASVALTWRLKFGANTVWGDAFGVSSTITGAYSPWAITGWIVNNNSASTQWCVLQYHSGQRGSDTGSIAGVGNETSSVFHHTGQPDGTRTLAESAAAALDVNTASDQTLALTAQWASASALVVVRKYYSVVELV